MKKIIEFFKKYLFLLGIILFIFILFKSNPEEILKNIKNVNFFYLVLAALLAFPILFTKSLCWNYIKRKQGIKYSPKNSFLMYCSGTYLGTLTPGKMGELAKIFYLKKDGYSIGRSLVSVILDRISDLAFLLILGFLFLITFQGRSWVLVLGIISVVFLFIIFLKIGLIKWVINKIFHILIPKKYQNSWKINFQDFINDLKVYKLKHYLIISLITVFSWCFYYLQMYILAKSTNLNIPFFYLAISITAAGLITLIPASISGIGTRDATLILLFAPFSILKEQAIVFSSLILLMSLFASLIGLICWFIKPIHFFK